MYKNIRISLYEQGRSMIEMLGVLAIVGVLSVGALAGYSMAMATHKANNIVYHLDEIVSIANDFCNGGLSCINGTDIDSIVINSGQIPDEEIKFSMIYLSDSPAVRISSMQFNSGKLLVSLELSSGDYASICRKMLEWVNINAYSIDFDGDGDMSLQDTYSVDPSGFDYPFPISTSNIATYCKKANSYLYMDVLLK
jgi:hypothetical protein